MLLEKYRDIFLLPGDKLGFTTVVQHEIPLKDDTLIHSKQYRHAPIHREVIRKDIEKKLKDNIIEPLNSPMSSPVIIVPKRNDAQGKIQWRLCIDYRKLNSQKVNDSFPLPNIANILDQLGKSQYFSCFDLASGYHQVLVKPEDRLKTAFSTPEGHWQFVELPISLSSAPSTFSPLMQCILKGLLFTEMCVYLDDIIVNSASLIEFDRKVRLLFDRLRAANLKLQPSKCNFFAKISFF